MLRGVVRSVWDDGVGIGIWYIKVYSVYSVYGGFHARGGSVYGYVKLV